MTRPEAVRFLRTGHSMAYPDGRLIAERDGQWHLLAPDGWTRLGPGRPAGAEPLSRAEAADWCGREGWDRSLLDSVPPLVR